MYDLKTATRLYVLDGHKKRLDACSFSTDGRRLVTVSLEESMVRVWKVGTSITSIFMPGAPPRQGHSGSQPYKTIPFNIGEDSKRGRIWRSCRGYSLYLFQHTCQQQRFLIGCVSNGQRNALRELRSGRAPSRSAHEYIVWQLDGFDIRSLVLIHSLCRFSQIDYVAGVTCERTPRSENGEQYGPGAERVHSQGGVIDLRVYRLFARLRPSVVRMRIWLVYGGALCP